LPAGPGNADCALTFIPFMEQCILPPDANGVLPPPPPPGTVDELGPFMTLNSMCAQNPEAARPTQ